MKWSVYKLLLAAIAILTDGIRARVVTMLWYVILVLCAVSLSIQNEADFKVVNISQGPVRGRKDPDGIYVFYNVPYATAPTGDNKFKVGTSLIVSERSQFRP